MKFFSKKPTSFKHPNRPNDLVIYTLAALIGPSGALLFANSEPEKSGWSIEASSALTKSRYVSEVFIPAALGGDRASRLVWESTGAQLGVAARREFGRALIDLGGSFGGIFSGTLDDEDYIPAAGADDPADFFGLPSGLIDPVEPGHKFSDTTSKLRPSKPGRVWGLSADVSPINIRTGRLTLHAGAGYFYDYAQLRAFGLNGFLNLNGKSSPLPPEGRSVEAVAYEFITHGPRLVTTGSYQLRPDLKATFSAKYSPWVHLTANDSHFLREDLGPTPNAQVTSHNVDWWQISVGLDYQVSEVLNLVADVSYNGFRADRSPLKARATTGEWEPNGGRESTQLDQATFAIRAIYRF